MISSLIWLYLLHIGKIVEGNEPWLVYLPIAFVEMFVYLKFLLPKIVDKIYGE